MTTPASMPPMRLPARLRTHLPDGGCSRGRARGISVSAGGWSGSCYRSRLWRDTLTAAGITRKRTRPYRPQTNGKVERYNRTLLNEWAYAQPYQSETERRRALPQWLHTYNHHRSHTALGNKPPASRVPNLTGQYS